MNEKKEINKYTQNTTEFSTDGNGTITGYYGNETNIVIPAIIDDEPIMGIGDLAFSCCRLKSVTISNGINSIGKLAFEENQLTSVIMPEGITIIKQGTFIENPLSSVTIPNSVKVIMFLAFVNNKLTSITIGANVDLVLAPFKKGFEEAYINGGRQAGTYTRPDTESENWTRQ